MHRYLEVLVSAMRESAVFVAGCAVVALVGTIVLGVPFLDGLGLVLLVASAGLMLIGGALSFVTPGKVKVFNMVASGIFKKQRANMTQEDYRRSESSAAFYSLTGVLLLGYSLVLAALFV